MANHKSAIKRARQNRERRTRNRHYRTLVRGRIKALRAAIDAGDLETAEQLLPSTVSTLQRVAQKGVLHKRNASRRISRLTRQVNALRTSQGGSSQGD